MKVLIADDEPVNRRLLEILLNKWGYDVSVAVDGEEAWRALQTTTRPRIAILDWMMPGMDGVQVCRKIRQDETGPSMYMLLLTARQATEDANGRFESVADDYLPKPYAAHELKARLRAARRILELEDQLEAARKTIQIETTHDPLTGLWNRSSILEILHHEIHRARRQTSSLAVLMVDIEHLGEVNHRHGHLVGDAVLREAARRIRSSIRLYDSVGRYGGGQFVIVSPACDRPGALSQAHRVRSKICLEPIETFEGDVPLTVRVGIAVGCDNHQAHDLISAADGALAEARKTGEPALVYDIHKLI
jgi:diguanylate cyclase (GGDEF)-like protein